jgi:DNA-binding winged helix-turn-helix (wHTH) protein/tetratricopeptide (TPR) repeat protein
VTHPETYTFGSFTLDVAERRLAGDAGPVALAPKAFDLLVVLVRRAGRLISKRDLLDAVWPESFVEEGILTVHVSALRKALGDTSRPPGYIETVAGSGYRFIAAVVAQALDRRVIPGRWSIAVLPPRSLTGGADGGRLIGLAIADALIDRLGRFDPVIVRPTEAVHTHANVDDPAAVGRMLQSDAVLDSSFERTSEGVRLNARLVRAEDGESMWRGEFDDSAGSAATGAVVAAVASRLGATLHDPATSRADTGGATASVPDTRLEVYELCGRGRSHLLSASMFEVPKAVDAFRAAVAADSTYAPAHAGLALAHCAEAAMRVAPLSDAYRDARAAALRALAVDNGSADAQVALGTVLFFAEWDWHGAEQSLRRAVELNPSHVQGRLMFGRLLDALGRTQEALDMKLQAFERDPFSPLVHVQIAQCYWNQRRYDDAIAWANKALALDPRHLLAREFLAGAYLHKGDFDRYLLEAAEHAASYGAPPDGLEPLKNAYATGGRSGFWRYALEQMSRSPRVPAFQVAVFQTHLGDIDAAFHYLDRAILEHDPSLVDLAVAPQWDSLRSDPRFGLCLARVGLQPGGSPPIAAC